MRWTDWMTIMIVMLLGANIFRRGMAAKKKAEKSDDFHHFICMGDDLACARGYRCCTGCPDASSCKWFCPLAADDLCEERKGVRI